MSLDVCDRAHRKLAVKRPPSRLAGNVSTQCDHHGNSGEQIGQQCWPVCSNPALAWLVNATSGERYLDCIFFELCRKLKTQGVPIVRASVFLQIIHPQWSMLEVFWLDGMHEPKLTLFGYGETSADPFYQQSLVAMQAGAEEYHGRPADALRAFGSSEPENIADYIAWSLPFTLGKRHLIYFATNEATGFSDDDWETLAEVLPVLSSVMDVRMKNGAHAVERLCRPACGRGDPFRNHPEGRRRDRGSCRRHR